MRCVSLLLPVLLVACSQQPTEDLAAGVGAATVRRKGLRAQCAADRTTAGEAACLAAADAFRRRFFAGETGPDEFRTLAELPPIPPSFDTPASDQDAMPFEGDVP